MLFLLLIFKQPTLLPSLLLQPIPPHHHSPIRQQGRLLPIATPLQPLLRVLHNGRKHLGIIHRHPTLLLAQLRDVGTFENFVDLWTGCWVFVE